MNIPFLNDVTLRGVLSTAGGTSTNWNTAYTNLVTNSAAYLLSGTDVDLGDIPALSSNWNSNYTTTTTNSAFWTNAYTNLVSNSAAYLLSGTEVNLGDIPALSGNWNSTYTTVNSYSATWSTGLQDLAFDENTALLSITNGNTVSLSALSGGGGGGGGGGDPAVNALVYSNSAKWNSTYTTLCANSATWNDAIYFVQGTPNQITAITTGGGGPANKTATLSLPNNLVAPGNVTILGNLTALGTSTFANTIFTTTSAISVINTGPGPALYVFQAAGPYDVASFYDGDGVEVLHVGNANPGGLGYVGINESFPGSELTVQGNISASRSITVAGGNSDQWNSNWSITNTNSGKWESNYTSFNTNSGNYDSVYTTVKSLSDSWEESASITPLQTASASWNSVYTTTNSNSGKWESNWTTTNTNSANWNSAYTTTNTNSASWGSSYTTLNNNSANYDSVYTTTNNNSALWSVAYTNLITNSAVYLLSGTNVNLGDIPTLSSNWNSNYSLVNSNSSSWSSVYSTTNTNSASWNNSVLFLSDTQATILSSVPVGYNRFEYARDLNNLFLQISGRDFVSPWCFIAKTSATNIGLTDEPENQAYQLGYNTDYITDKKIVHSYIGYSNSLSSNGGILFNLQRNVMQIYRGGKWRDILDTVNVKQDEYNELEFLPDGFTEWININSGDSDTYAFDGLPYAQQYRFNVGATQVPLRINGGVF